MAKDIDKKNGNENDGNENDVWKDIKEKADNLKYGSINITLHDGKIVQVETSTKIRY